MLLSLIFFLISFLGDFAAYYLFQKFLDSGKKDYLTLTYCIVCATACWVFIFALQTRGYALKTFIPLWASGTAVFGYFAASLLTHTPFKEIFSPVSVVSLLAVGLGIFFLAHRFA